MLVIINNHLIDWNAKNWAYGSYSGLKDPLIGLNGGFVDILMPLIGDGWNVEEYRKVAVNLAIYNSCLSIQKIESQIQSRDCYYRQIPIHKKWILSIQILDKQQIIFINVIINM